MPLSPADASAALAELQEAQSRSATLRGYQSAAPHLIIWGMVWFVGYIATALAPAWSGPVWLCLAIGGTAAGILAARADRPTGGKRAIMGWLLLIFFLFIGATFAIMRPAEPGQIGAFIPLVVAVAYAIAGLLGAARLLVLGAALAALTLGGFFALPAQPFLLWMAVVGGGSLVLGGLWLRRV